MTVDIDWNDPVARFNLIESVGHEEYNRRIKAYLDANPIRPVTTRFGTLYAVTNTEKHFQRAKKRNSSLSPSIPPLRLMETQHDEIHIHSFPMGL